MRLDDREERERKPLPPCVIREARPEDRGMIFGMFLKSAHSGFVYRSMAEPAFKNYGARLLETLINRSQVITVSKKGDADTLLGFAIAERPFKHLGHIVLHFIYIKYDYRQQGLGSAMIKALGHDGKNTTLFATHMNPAWFLIGPKFGAVYNPFLLWPEFHTNKEEAA